MMENQQQLPNGTAVLILGIASVLASCCTAILGIPLAIIGIYLAKKDMKLYNANPNAYTNYGNLNTGRILSIIGLVLGILSILYFVFILVTTGSDEIFRQYNDILDQAQAQ